MPDLILYVVDVSGSISGDDDGLALTFVVAASAHVLQQRFLESSS